MKNVDAGVTDGFGDEWARFDQSALSPEEKQRIFDEYFGIFPWNSLPIGAVGADFGCGSGRWASVVAPRVKRLHCIDASRRALEVAKRNLCDHDNCVFELSSIDDVSIPDASLDFAYSLGVLHHVPDHDAALQTCVRKLKNGAPLLVYLYYRFDNRPVWFRAAWQISDVIRRAVSRLPSSARYFITQIVALLVYLPLASLARLLRILGVRADSLPLSYYADKTFYVMRTDALDRFGTRLEKRFTRAEVTAMMTRAGLTRVAFGERPPFWCAVGYRS